MELQLEVPNHLPLLSIYDITFVSKKSLEHSETLFIGSFFV